ncbi:hypothetical protein [Mycoplasmopsis fermentans]|uniref:hypothetical protein n=1 Tax=Mycoplasmopsis fermentans TaxID=2115 RepID=UPI000F013F95|nr:hypothetical protein [Mycoplasmopsis fermentans]RMX36158.1 putative lipoprotein [Mycoplasmopsis fermentans MF-I2]
MKKLYFGLVGASALLPVMTVVSCSNEDKKLHNEAQKLYEEYKTKKEKLYKAKLNANEITQSLYDDVVNSSRHKDVKDWAKEFLSKDWDKSKNTKKVIIFNLKRFLKWTTEELNKYQ